MVVLAKDAHPGEGYLLGDTGTTEYDFVIITGEKNSSGEIAIWMPPSSALANELHQYYLRPVAKLEEPTKIEHMKVFIRMIFEGVKYK
jgi:hypothetical protein